MFPLALERKLLRQAIKMGEAIKKRDNPPCSTTVPTDVCYWKIIVQGRRSATFLFSSCLLYIRIFLGWSILSNGDKYIR